METGFNDKTGKPIRVGDVVQMTAPGKTGGRRVGTIVQKGKSYAWATPRHNYPNIEIKLDQNWAARMVIIDHDDSLA